MQEITGITVNMWLILVFVIGYACIIFEEKIGINKATCALLMAVICWAFVFSDHHLFKSQPELISTQFSLHLATVSQVVLFLLGALTVVKTIQVHGGLQLIMRLIRVDSKRGCLWIIGFITFFLSSILDNLTTTIFMLSMLKERLAKEDRLIFGTAIVIAANAGGVWTPIGDVTTTMLWIGGQISTLPLMHYLLLPSLTCLLVALSWFSFCVQGKMERPAINENISLAPHGKLVFGLGLLSLIFVPFFRVLTGLPPFMGMILAMSFIWLVTDFLHRHHKERLHLRILSIFTELDLSAIFFFLGILLSIGALEANGVLKMLAQTLDHFITSKEVVATFIGLVSSVIDNVPLVAACMGMYDLALYPCDSSLWLLIAYCAGAGGSLLLIGSAAGVALMSVEQVDFFTYLRKATLPALLGYFAGILSYGLMPYPGS
jgi:Na+/H+ antiporter NhaD/arsenite permease-like protein